MNDAVTYVLNKTSLSANLVVASRHGQDVASDGPADVPNHVVELVQQFGRPRVARRLVARPDEHASVLQCPLDEEEEEEETVGVRGQRRN